MDLKKEYMNQNILIESDKKELLTLARLTLTFYLKNNKHIPENPLDLNVIVSDNMKQIMGAFVTLHEGGNLKGCIGEIIPRRELYKAVMDHSINSAVYDSRFSPVQLKELPFLKFEISALTKPECVASYNDIIIGKHGIVLEKSGRSAVFLPQVASEQKWNLETTLSHLSYKAGLSINDWKNETSFSVFEAIVFSEE